MIAKFTILLIIASFISFAESYSINGPWKLQVDSSFKNITQNQSIIFDFSKQIKNGTISDELTVLACSVIDFTYTLEDNEILFLMKRIGVNRRQCIKDQVFQIISRMEKVAFTNTFANTLTLLSPSGKTLFKLVKVEAGKRNLNHIAAAWQVFQLSDENSSILIKANSSIIQFCQGNATVQYKISSQSKIQFSIKQTKGCSENDLLTALYRTKYFRPYNDQLWFFNKQVDQIMKWSNIGDIESNKPLTFPPKFLPNVVTANTSTGNDSRITQNKTISIKTNSRRQADSLDFPTSNKSNMLLNNQIKSNKSQTITLNSVLDVATTQNITNSTGISFNISTNISANKSYLNNVTKQEIYRRWSLLGGKKIDQITIYPNSIVQINCGVLTLVYSIKSTFLGVIEILSPKFRSSIPQCQGKNGPIQNVIEELRFITMRLGLNSQKILQWRNKNFQIIAEFS